MADYYSEKDKRIFLLPCTFELCRGERVSSSRLNVLGNALPKIIGLSYLSYHWRLQPTCVKVFSASDPLCLIALLAG